ncbi:unnamed protein product [Arabis nemorensis]|uniref:Uncharacterized protein n=1 Tax=Arabis nemorensis TaxID=586526 RepID=A0A565ASC9_9BRAS|nr:unnamed protein product [Arabis nemorensis]
MSMSSEDEPHITEEPTPTKNKRQAVATKGSKAKRAKSSVTVKSKFVKGVIAQHLRTRTPGKVVIFATTIEGSGESDSGIPPTGTGKATKRKHATPAISHLSEDTEAPIPSFLLRCEANRKLVLDPAEERYKFMAAKNFNNMRILSFGSSNSSDSEELIINAGLLSTVTEMEPYTPEVVRELYANLEDMEIRDDGYQCVYVRGAMYEFSLTIINQMFQLQEYEYDPESKVPSMEDPIELVAAELSQGHVNNWDILTPPQMSPKMAFLYKIYFDTSAIEYGKAMLLKAIEYGKIIENLSKGILATINKADIECYMSVPLENLSSTIIAYKAWELEHGIDLDRGPGGFSKVSPQVADANKKALQMYSERAYLEGQISKKDFCDPEKFQQLMLCILSRTVDIYHKYCVGILPELKLCMNMLSLNIWFQVISG